MVLCVAKKGARGLKTVLGLGSIKDTYYHGVAPVA